MRDPVAWEDTKRTVTLGTGIEDRIVHAMKSLGFTATDAKAYVALLKEHPASGYELAARSGVPRSAIYNVLRHMKAMGLVNAIQDKPARYVPLAPDKLFDLLETRFGKSLEMLKDSLDGLVGQATEAVTWTVQGYAAMLEQAESLIASSRRTIHASLWAREADKLSKALERRIADGVEVVLFSFNRLPEHLGRVFAYGLDERDLENDWTHKIILVSDTERVLVGGGEQTDLNRAVVTEEQALVEMAISNLVLDITLFGQRTGASTTNEVATLTQHMAPVDELVAERLRQR